MEADPDILSRGYGPLQNKNVFKRMRGGKVKEVVKVSSLGRLIHSDMADMYARIEKNTAILLLSKHYEWPSQPSLLPNSKIFPSVPLLSPTASKPTCSLDRLPLPAMERFSCLFIGKRWKRPMRVLAALPPVARVVMHARTPTRGRQFVRLSDLRNKHSQRQ